MKTTLIDYLTTQIKRKGYESSLHAKMLEDSSGQTRLTALGHLEDCQLETIKLNECIEWLNNCREEG